MIPFGFGLGANYEAISSKYPFGMRLPRASLLSIRDQCLLIHLSLAQQVLVIEVRSVNLLCSVRPNYYLPYNPYEIRWLERPILVGINNDI